VESRKLQLPIDAVYKFADIGKAFEHIEANKHLGKKIVVTLQPTSCVGRISASLIRHLLPDTTADAAG
jgi:hypothetical protein